MGKRMGRGRESGARAQRWILTALGKDRPGIVAAVTKILYQRGCNLEDSAMTRLAGEFAILLIFSAPASLSQQRLEEAFGALSRRLRLAIHLKAMTPAEITPVRHGRPHVISVYGADRPGIVYRVSERLARLGLNITDVSTHRTAGRRTAKPLYLMLLEVELPDRIAANSLLQRLRKLAKRLGVEVSLRSAEASVF
jgi:glycine cleavage system transcriptional repressor